MTHAAQATAPIEHIPLYDRVGGEAGVRRLVETFYDIIETRPEGQPVFVLHLRGHGIPHARIEQFNFLSGFFGGPKLFAEKWGHSNVREIHAHVGIDATAKDAWLECMAMTLDELEYAQDLKALLMKHFTVIATRLVNRDQAPG